MSQYTKQANEFAAKHGITLTVLGCEYKKYWHHDKELRYVFTLRLKRNRKQHTFTFAKSIAAGAEEPTIYVVLACLIKYDVGSFDDFCSEFGYDTDSITAKHEYKAVCKEYAAVKRLFGDILEDLQEIQ